MGQPAIDQITVGGSILAIEDLQAFIPPPPSPIQNMGEWSAAEADLGVVFPADFKDLIRVYGTGEFCGNLAIENPLKKWGRDGIRQHLHSYRELREACEYSFPLFPESAGLLPWGRDTNGHLYCWWTEGSPDDWQIVQLFHGYEDDPLAIVPGPITQFLIDFVSNKYPNMLGGNEFTPENRFFRVGILGRELGEA